MRDTQKKFWRIVINNVHYTFPKKWQVLLFLATRWFNDSNEIRIYWTKNRGKNGQGYDLTDQAGV